MHAMTSYNTGTAVEATISSLLEARCNVNHIDYGGFSAYGLMLYSCNEWMIPLVSFTDHGAITDRMSDMVSYKQLLCITYSVLTDIIHSFSLCSLY